MILDLHGRSHRPAHTAFQSHNPARIHTDVTDVQHEQIRWARADKQMDGTNVIKMEFPVDVMYKFFVVYDIIYIANTCMTRWHSFG